MLSERIIPFWDFDERGDVRTYNSGLLPHWRQDSCTYFITFRLADSLPQAMLKEIREERDSWLKTNGIDPALESWRHELDNLSDVLQRDYRRVVSVAMEDRLDAGAGKCILKDPQCASVVENALHFHHGSRVLTGDFVIMPNHVHAILRPLTGFELEEILKSIKGFSASQINKLKDATGHVWQKDSYDHIVRNFEQLEAFQRYILANPRKAGLKKSQYRLYHARFAEE